MAQDITIEPSALDIAQLVSYFIVSSNQSLTARRLAYQLDTLKKTVAQQAKQIEKLTLEKNSEYYRGVNDTEEIWDEKLTELKTAHEIVVNTLNTNINELNTIINGHATDQLISQFEMGEAEALRELIEQQNKQLADQVDLLIITKEIV